MLDAGNSSIGAYVAFNDGNGTSPSRILLYNSAFFSGDMAPTSANITLTNLPASTRSVSLKRLSASNATSLEGVTISGGSFNNGNCLPIGTQDTENIPLNEDGFVVVSVRDSEAVIVSLD